jgi:hypothetical protein
MECVICGGKAKKVVENRKGRYRKEVVDVQSEFFRCESCKETFFSPHQLEAHNRAIKNEIRKKYGLLPPEKIVEIRNKLELTQPELPVAVSISAASHCSCALFHLDCCYVNNQRKLATIRFSCEGPPNE